MRRSVGVEEELLIVDAVTHHPVPRAAELLAHDAAAHPAPAHADAPWGRLVSEIQLEQVELNTAPQTDLAELEADVLALRRRAATAASATGARVAALATSPIPVLPTLTPSPRYQWLADRYGAMVVNHLINGCHVHVGVESPEEAVAVLDRVRIWLPTLLALSANSPFWDGRDTGYASFRSRVWARWPTGGPAEVFGSVATAEAHVQRMIDAGVILDRAMVYLEARPSHHLPTVEFRVTDVCIHPWETVLVAALCRALVDDAADSWRDGHPPPDVPASTLRMAAWQAARDGLDGDLLDPHRHRPLPAADVTAQLMDRLTDALRHNGDLDTAAAALARLHRDGTGARLQRAVYRRTGDLAAVGAHVVALTA